MPSTTTTLSTTTSLHMELLDQRKHIIERYFKHGRMNQYHLIMGKYGNLTFLSRYIDVRSDNKVDLERKMGYLYVNLSRRAFEGYGPW